MSKKRIKNTENTNNTFNTFIEKVWETFWGVVLFIGIAFLWFFLFGRYHTIFFERAPITPLYAEWWVYQSIEIFSITGIGLAFFSIRTLIKNYKGNIWLQVERNVLYQIAIYLIFLIATPQYTIQLLPQLFGFTDLKGEYVTNPKLYFFWIDDLGFKSVRYYKFQTLDDAIQGLEFAKERDDKKMYEYIFDDLEKFGYENVIKKYKNEGFQMKLLLKFVSVDFMNGEYEWEKESVKEFFKNERFIELLKDNTLNRQIKESCLYIEERFTLYQQGKITQKDFFSKLYMEVENLFN